MVTGHRAGMLSAARHTSMLGLAAALVVTVYISMRYYIRSCDVEILRAHVNTNDHCDVVSVPGGATLECCSKSQVSFHEVEPALMPSKNFDSQESIWPGLHNVAQSLGEVGSSLGIRSTSLSRSAEGPQPTSSDGLHVVVTGGAGYIGSHAALRLLTDGHAVTIVDNLSRGNPGAIRALQKVAAPSQLRFVYLDLGDGAAVRQLFIEFPVDVVIHFAAVAYVAESYRNPLLYYRNVTANTLNVLEAMEFAGIKKLVYSSTCATYGSPRQMPITESTPQRPVSPYGTSKLTAEKMIKEKVYSQSDFSVMILRYFNVIGADPEGRLGEFPTSAEARAHGRISGACFDAAKGERDSLSIMGADHPTPDGTCVRDYIHVVDLVDAHVLSIKGFRIGKALVYNVGLGKGYSVREFVDACIDVTGVNITVKVGERRPGDAAEVYCNPSKIKRELGWVPKFDDLRAALGTAWNWTRAHPNGYT